MFFTSTEDNFISMVARFREEIETRQRLSWEVTSLLHLLNTPGQTKDFIDLLKGVLADDRYLLHNSATDLLTKLKNIAGIQQLLYHLAALAQDSSHAMNGTGYNKKHRSCLILLHNNKVKSERTYRINNNYSAADYLLETFLMIYEDMQTPSSHMIPVKAHAGCMIN